MAFKDIFPTRLGFGAAPLGNMFRAIPEEEALATVDAAWNAGIRYFDNAPFYGAGLAELRMGEALAGKPRDQYAISTKVGRLILDEVEDVSARDLGEKGEVFKYGRPNRIVNDYSADATLLSIEDSLKRLRTDRIDIAWVHDVAQDFYGDEWLAVFESASATPQILDRVLQIRAIAERHGISMKAAGLHFVLENPAIAAVIPGASRPERIAEDIVAYNQRVPADFWRDLRQAGLVNAAAHLPLIQ